MPGAVLRSPPPRPATAARCPPARPVCPRTGQPFLTSDCIPPGPMISRQGPARKRQKQFPRAGGQNQPVPNRISRAGPVGCSASKQHRGSRPAITLVRSSKRGPASLESLDPLQGLAGPGFLAAPDLSAQPGSVIHHADAASAFRRRAGGGQAGRAGAHHHDFKVKPRSFIGPHLHAFLAKGLATPAMGLAVDRHPAFHANAHPAERSARLPVTERRNRVMPACADGGGDNRPAARRQRCR